MEGAMDEQLAIDEQSMGQEAMEVSIDFEAIDQGVIEGAMHGYKRWAREQSKEQWMVQIAIEGAMDRWAIEGAMDQREIKGAMDQGPIEGATDQEAIEGTMNITSNR